MSSPEFAHARKTRRVQTYPAVRFIIIQPKNVFDPDVPGEDKWPYRAANVIHFTTREHVIRRELLVKPGEPADQDLLDESERILRALSFIKDVRIKTVPVGDGRVDVVVETHDTWTTEPQVDFGRQGERNHFSMGMVEENLFGYGKSVSYFYKEDPDGVRHEYGYTDPQLFGSRVRLDSLYQDNPTGNEQHLTLSHPFYSLATKAAGGSTWNHSRGFESIVTNGVETTTYRRDHHDLDTFVGVRLNRDPYSVHRLSLHYLYFSDYFTPIPTTPPGTLPVNKTITGPVPRWDWIQSRFIKETFVDKAERVEDINLGHQMEASAGYAARALGSTAGTIPFTFSDKVGFGKEGDAFAIGSVGTVGRFNTYGASREAGQLSNTLYFLNANRDGIG